MRSGAVKVLAAQHKLAACGPGALLGGPKRPRMAQMQIPGGGRRQPSAITGGGGGHGLS